MILLIIVYRIFIKILLIYILYHLCNPQTIPDTIPKSRMGTGDKSIVCYYGVYPLLESIVLIPNILKNAQRSTFLIMYIFLFKLVFSSSIHVVLHSSHCLLLCSSLMFCVLVKYYVCISVKCFVFVFLDSFFVCLSCVLLLMCTFKISEFINYCEM